MNNSKYKPGYFENQNSCDGSCAVELCGDNKNLNFCERSTICNDDVYTLPLIGLTNKYLCSPSSTDLSVTATNASCYPQLVTPSDICLSSCEEVNETKCVLKNVTSCVAMCNTFNPTASSDCVLSCKSDAYNCSTLTTYRNCESPTCVYDNAGMNDDDCIHSYSVDLDQQFACYEDRISVCSGKSCTVTAAVYIETIQAHKTTCRNTNVCTDYPCDTSINANDSRNVKCLLDKSNATNYKTKNPFSRYALDSGTNFRGTCQPLPEGGYLGLKGQPICPYGSVYVPAKDYCYFGTKNCDSGFKDDTIHGCGDLFQEEDKFGLYTNYCFTGSGKTYVQACCLDYTILSGTNVYEVYTDDLDDDHIKIY